MQEQFVHLHVHSEYSLLDGAGRLQDLVKQAKALGYQALALTDHGVMYGSLAFYQACQQAGIKPIIGVEAYVCNELKGEAYHLVLLAENRQGYQNLLKLTTKAHLEGFYYKPRVSKEWLSEHREGLICLSACLAGEVQRFLLRDAYEQAKQVALEYQEIFGPDQFFLELQDHNLPEQKKVNHGLVKLSEETGIPLVVTNDVHYVQPEDAVPHDCLLCIGTGKKLADQDRLRFQSSEFYLKSPEEMLRLFPQLSEAYRNTWKIAQRCNLEIPLGQTILPKYPVPEGKVAMEYLRELCLQGVEKRYGQLKPEIQERLDYELQVIGQTGYADYFLIVWDFMRFAHEQKILTGPGRGSAAGSLVAYVLFITNIDPLKYRLLFERFLNPERVTMPDIDIDFSDQRRDEVLQYVAQKYGRERVAQIITFGTLGAKAAIRDVGRVLGVSLAVIDRLAKQIPGGLHVTLQSAWQESASLRQMLEEDEQLANVFTIAQQLEGVARHTSTHAAGVVISEEPLSNYVPLQVGHEGIALTQYAMEDLEALGLLKMDFLGLRNLSLLEEIVHFIQQQVPDQQDFSLEQIPLDDEATFQLLSSGDTLGVFQLESGGMRQVLKRLKPSTFEDVIAVLALYRPGPMQNIPLFIQAKHGEIQVEYPHPTLQEILQDTYGIIVYQEQIMQIASKMAGFSLGEADLLRRAVSKKQKEVLEEERTHFVQGCLQQGYSQEIAEHVYDLIVRFANYGFNRSHSAAYALIAYQLGYLKAHYPVAFIAALLSAAIGQQEKISLYLAQATRRNIQVLPPSIQHSQATFSIEDGQIRLGFGVIKNVGTTAISEILSARAKAPFRNLLDFCQRVNIKVVNRRVVEALIFAGALDELGMHRAKALANLDEILTMAERAQSDRNSDQLFFFADELPDDYPWREVSELPILEQLKMEKEVLGFYLSAHPLDMYQWVLNSYQVTPLESIEIESMKENVPIRVLGSVAKVKRIKTRKGEGMCFITLEDQRTELEVIIFPNLYQHSPLLWQEGNILLLEGRLQANEERRQLIAEKALDVQNLKKPQELFVKIPAEKEEHGLFQALQSALRRYPGQSPVYLYYESSKQTIILNNKVAIQQELLTALQQLLGNAEWVKVREIT